MVVVVDGPREVSPAASRRLPPPVPRVRGRARGGAQRPASLVIPMVPRDRSFRYFRFPPPFVRTRLRSERRPSSSSTASTCFLLLLLTPVAAAAAIDHQDQNQPRSAVPERLPVPRRSTSAAAVPACGVLAEIVPTDTGIGNRVGIVVLPLKGWGRGALTVDRAPRTHRVGVAAGESGRTGRGRTHAGHPAEINKSGEGEGEGETRGVDGSRP